MKKSFVILLMLISGIAMAQKPLHVHGFAVVAKPAAWYREQMNAWKKELNNNPGNSYAWYNYYRATRNLVRTDTTDKRPHAEKTVQLKQVMEEMAKAVPQSFEYNLCVWMNGGNDYENFLSNLKKAVELGPDRIELFSEVIVWGEIERDIKKRDEYSLKWYHSEMLQSGLTYYNYNVLVGLKPNAIILTNGDNDTYPLWMLQALGIRRDVTVLNASLLNIESYRNKVFKELGIKPWQQEAGADTSATIRNRNRSKQEKEIITHMADNSKNAPVYIGLTCSDQYTKPIEANLYLTGLAYEYSTKNIDNMALLRKNFEQVYALDYIDKPFYNDIGEHYTRLTSMNYIVPMIKLYDHYKASNDAVRMTWIRNKIEYIVKGRAEEKETLKYLNQ